MIYYAAVKKRVILIICNSNKILRHRTIKNENCVVSTVCKHRHVKYTHTHTHTGSKWCLYKSINKGWEINVFNLWWRQLPLGIAGLKVEGGFQKWLDFISMF